jgi:hypothetical protein
VIGLSQRILLLNAPIRATGRIPSGKELNSLHGLGDFVRDSKGISVNSSQTSTLIYSSDSPQRFYAPYVKGSFRPKLTIDLNHP